MESPVVREVAEETGVQVCAGGEIGRRTHPATGRTIIYLACSPTNDAEPAVAAAREVTEVRWARRRQRFGRPPHLRRRSGRHVVHTVPNVVGRTPA